MPVQNSETAPFHRRARPALALALSAGAVLLAAGLLSSELQSRKPGPIGRTLFINFRGVVLKDGPWDPLKNTAQMPLHRSGPKQAVFPFYSPPCKTDSDCRAGTCSIAMPERKAHTYNPFKEKPFKRCSQPDPLHERQIIYFAKRILADFNVQLVSERPTSGDYDMIIMNYNSTMGIPHGGSAGFGCNRREGNMMAFVQDARWGHSAKNLAKIIAHEFGHTLSLDHTAGETRTDPMGAGGWAAAIPQFEDRCLKHARKAKDGCAVARKHCPAGQHNTYRIMLDRLGPRLQPETLVFPEDTGNGDGERLSFSATHGNQKPGKRLSQLCKTGQLVGLHWHYGTIVDRVRGICSDGSQTGDLGVDSGNGPKSFVCDGGADDRIVGLSARAFGFGNAIEQLKIRCQSGSTRSVGGWGKDGSWQTPELSCPDGTQAIGLRGNRGEWLNSIGLACQAVKASAAPARVQARGQPFRID